ncbi:hypothetical protein GALL_509650 [mine drainage metagenome]|uniref:Uncharacterized protein n=1 Tax=mine drainage metagenome TaxID=410659 RepID=A0A1J5P9N3_9ZZZZ
MPACLNRQWADIWFRNIPAQEARQDLSDGCRPGQADLDEAVEAPRAPNGRIDLVERIGGRDQHTAFGLGQAVDLLEQRVDDLSLVILVFAGVLGACAERVNLVDEKHAWRCRARVSEALPEGAQSVPEVPAGLPLAQGCRKESGSSGARDQGGREGFAGTWTAENQQRPRHV